MGSFVELNDTLQITKEQGFPVELNFDKHREKNFTVEDFAGRIFEFSNKPNIRIYRGAPIRTFLVENINNKWLYWGLIYLTEVNHDLVNMTTSGKYKIIKIFTPEEMKVAYDVVDDREGFNFLEG